MSPEYHAVDFSDMLILYSGTFSECVRVQEESYAGLTVINDELRRSYGDDLKDV
jgi:hypothetical protein